MQVNPGEQKEQPQILRLAPELLIAPKNWRNSFGRLAQDDRLILNHEVPSALLRTGASFRCAKRRARTLSQDDKR
jgi:hypothetical protein